MDMNKELDEFDVWFDKDVADKLDNWTNKSIMLEAWKAAKTRANQQFESFLNQAIEDSACADERRSLQVLLEDFQDNLEADKRKGQKRVAVNLEDL